MTDGVCHCEEAAPHSKKEVAGRKNGSGSASTKKVCGCDLLAMWRHKVAAAFSRCAEAGSLRHAFWFSRWPELAAAFTCLKGHNQVCHCEERKRQSNLDRKNCFALLAMTRSRLWGVATILANTFFRECTRWFHPFEKHRYSWHRWPWGFMLYGIPAGNHPFFLCFLWVPFNFTLVGGA